MCGGDARRDLELSELGVLAPVARQAQDRVDDQKVDDPE